MGSLLREIDIAIDRDDGYFLESEGGDGLLDAEGGAYLRALDPGVLQLALGELVDQVDVDTAATRLGNLGYGDKAELRFSALWHVVLLSK
jgi:hypothetical protein